MLKLTKFCERGRSMIEMIGYLSVMSALTVSIAAAVSTGYNKYRMGRVNQELTDLQKVISQRYVADQDYSEVKWDDLCADNIGPYTVVPAKKKEGDKVKCATNKGYHSLGGEVNIGSKDPYETYYIEFKGLTAKVCTELALRLWMTNNGSDLEAIEIFEGSTKKGKWTWPSANCSDKKCLPVKLTDLMAAKACQGKGINNSIVWYFN